MDQPEREPGVPEEQAPRSPLPAPLAIPPGESGSAGLANPAASTGSSATKDGKEPFYRWRTALLVLAVSFFVVSIQPLLPRPVEGEGNATAEAITASSSMEQLKDLSLSELLGWFFSNPLIQISVLTSACLASSWASSSRLRRKWEIGRVTTRDVPGFLFFDVLVLMIFSAAPMVVWGLVQVALQIWQLPRSDAPAARDGAAALLGFAAQFFGYSVGLVMVFLLVWRRGDSSGLDGVWPFWKPKPGERPRDVLRDISLGVKAFFLSYWLLSLTALLNLFLLWQWGWSRADENQLLEIVRQEVSGPGRTSVLLLLALSAAVGAAFFEEIIFRGILYNACKRYLGRWAGAIASALVFALIHNVQSNILPLFTLALILTWLYERTGRLLAPMALHFVNNSIAILVTLLQVYRSP